jgi:S1-C subfamily serine protease
MLVAGTARAQDLRYPVSIRGQFTTAGMLVQVVVPGSPEAVAGLQRGDLIMKVDGQPITSQADLVSIINSSGGTVTLSVRRATGQMGRIKVDLTGGIRKGAGPAAPYMLGVTGLFRPLGMLIQRVIPHTPAARIGLQPGDLIVRLNGQVVRTQRDLFTLLNSSGGKVVLDVVKGTTKTAVRLKADLKVHELGVLGDFLQVGFRVRVVAPGTAADRIGLGIGDIITRIDNRVIRTQEDMDRALRVSEGSVRLVVKKALGPVVILQADLVNNPLGAWSDKVNDGLRIVSVTPGSPAAALGLERGDILIKVDNTRVRTNKQLTEALQNSGGAATLLVRKGGQLGQLTKLEVVLGW